MHYKVKGISIKSENAAKPIQQSSRYLIDWISAHGHVDSSLDYGCGKLRYTGSLYAISSSLAITDSKIQLERTQLIDGAETSVLEYVQDQLPGCIIYDLESFWNGIQEEFDFILCANVLSAVPSAKVRAKSLRAVRSALKDNGQLLVVNQHTNSYFTQIKNDSRSIQHLDGWITQSRNGGAYYGLLNKEAIVTLLARFGFKIIDAWVEGQSNYVLAGGNNDEIY